MHDRIVSQRSNANTDMKTVVILIFVWCKMTFNKPDQFAEASWSSQFIFNFEGVLPERLTSKLPDRIG